MAFSYADFYLLVICSLFARCCEIINRYNKKSPCKLSSGVSEWRKKTRPVSMRSTSRY